MEKQKNHTAEFPKEPEISNLQLKSSETRQINHFIELHSKGQLTKKIVNEWLNGLPEKDREKYQYELESGMVEKVNNLPE